jgi:hypothetical protein
MGTKGWDRASLDFNVRPDKVERDISRADLLVPTNDSRLRLLAICLACGAMISLLFVWTTLAMFALMGLVSARTVYTIVVGAAIVAGLAVFVFATWDFKRAEEWARNA